MTVELGRLKRGDDKTFRTITVTVDGVAPDLSGEDWTVAAQLRTTADALAAITLTIDQDALTDGDVILSLTAATTAAMTPRTYLGDLEVSGPNGKQSSETFTVVVKADVTRSA